MRGWLRRGAYAAQLAGDRADLWPAGALAWLAYPGWVPFLLVVGSPDTGDLAFLGVKLVSAGAFPLNVIALGVAVVAGVGLLCLLAGMAEAALLRTAAAPQAVHPPFGRAALVAFGVIVIAALPASLALAAALIGLATVAPAEFQSPDFGTPIGLRLAGALLPYLILLALAVLAGQAFGGVALRRALAAGAPRMTVAMFETVRDLVQRPWQRLGVAATGLLADLLAAALTFALLRVLWAPIAAELSAGRLASPETLLLLVGFVAIWLALLLAAGALHVTLSAWWALELARVAVAPQEASAAAGPRREEAR